MFKAVNLESVSINELQSKTSLEKRSFLDPFLTLHHPRSAQ